VRLLAATGNSQLAFLERLSLEKDINWTRVELFHLDEYVGIGQDHPASFARYIRQRVIEPLGIRRFHLIDGLAEPSEVVQTLTREIRRAPIDIAFAGIGENGHLAFNDPPADFETQEAYAVVKLDRKCREQQVGEGWFPSIDAVPSTAISITVPQLMQAHQIVCVVPDERKAKAVRDVLERPVSPAVPASILQRHPHATVFLDSASSSLLKKENAS
jgi:glucosamine-6-phosphate deaminase